jgi:hypothetical protein
MAMEDAQTRALTTLAVGEAAVFGTGDDSPLLVRVPLVKDPMSPNPPRNDQVAEHMVQWRGDPQVKTLFLPRPFCADTCAGAPDACATARRLMAEEYVQRTVARTVLATIEQPDAVDRLWDDLLGVIQARRPPRLAAATLLRAFTGHAADWYAQRRGAQGRWAYTDTNTLANQLRAVLLDKLDGPSGATPELRAAFQTTARALHVREFPPYPVCDHVCTQDPPLCLYRAAVADLVAAGRYQQSWRGADAADATSPDNRRQQTWEVCQDAAYEIIEFPEPGASAELNDQIIATARRVCLCFEQQMLVDDSRKVPRTARRILARVLTEAGL